jgi:hypothetical protein
MGLRLVNSRHKSASALPLMAVLFLHFLGGVVSIAMLCWPSVAWAVVDDGGISGTLKDPNGKAAAGAVVDLVERADGTRREAKADESGHYSFNQLPLGEYSLTADYPGFEQIGGTLLIASEATMSMDLQFRRLATRAESVTVISDVSGVDIFNPDPTERVMIRNEILDANPGRPGMPVSIPGMPVESPAGGVKPPQYFVPGVAGDHGEPIAMFFQVGSYLFQNNLPANAHGNGYADPNVIIPIAIDNIQTDGGAFNVRLRAARPSGAGAAADRRLSRLKYGGRMESCGSCR